MNERDGFGSGFLLGSLVGGVLGGLIGAAVATRLSELPAEEDSEENGNNKESTNRGLKWLARATTANDQQSIEIARRSLEDKIAQLNEAIDDVRQQLNSEEEHSESLSEPG